MKEDKKIITALRKAKSHLDNVIAMTEDKKYCIDILQQNLAVIGLLKSANNKLLNRHLNNCFKQAIGGANGKNKRKMVDEVLKINKLIT